MDINPQGRIRVDTVMAAGPCTGTGETISSYIDMANYRKCIFVIQQSSHACTYATTGPNTIVRRIQAVSSTGSGAIVAGSSAEIALGSTYTISTTSYVLNKASYVILTCNTSAASGDSVKINDVTFTVGAAGGTSELASTRLLVTSSGPNIMEHLEDYVNSAAYGVKGVKALCATNTLTLTADETPITITISGSNTSGGFYVSSFRQVAHVAIDSAELASASSYRYVAIGLTPGSSALYCITAIRTGARYSVDTANLHIDDNPAGL